MTDPLMFRRAPRPAGIFAYPPLKLEIRHRALGTFDMLAARTRAGEMCEDVEKGREALETLGVETDAILTAMGQEGLRHFIYLAELLVGSIEAVTVDGVAATSDPPMSAESIYGALVGDPGLFVAWEQHAGRSLASASEGNAFALSPTTNGAAGANTAEAAIH